MMKNRKLPIPVAAGLGLIALFAFLLGVNVLVSHWSWRVDLTAERAFTLSEGTRKILADLPAPVQVRFYSNQGDEAMPMGLKNHAQNVNDLLGAMQQAAGGKLEVQQLDPQPDSAAEESARLDGVDPQILPDGGRIYLGLAFSQDDRKTALPFLAPDRERLLEYDLARAVSSVTTAVRPVLGLLTPLPTSPTPGMMSLIDRPPSAGVFFDELRRSFDLKEIPFASEEIPADIKTLLVVHPREISEATQYAIDQFVLRGGRLVAFLDPMCVMDAAASNPAMRMPPPSVSTLSKLLPAWGVQFNPAEIVVDMQNVGSTRRGRAPGILALGPDSVDPDSVVSGNVGSLFLALAGAFQGEPAEGASKSTLVFSSPQSALSDPGFVQTSPEVVERDFKPSGVEYPLAIKLEGRFKSAFPSGKPRVTPEGQAALPDAATSPDPTAPPGLKESVEPTAIYLVADADMLFDPLAVAEMTTPSGRPVIVPANGNLDLAQAMVEQLAGGDALSAVRSRATRDRPFTVVRRLQAEAEGKFRGKIAELENGLSETQARLAALAQSKDPAQQLILTPEQEAEIKAFRAREAAAKKELKEVRKTLRREVESLEQRVKWINILAMPLLIAAGGLIIALWRHRRQRAR
jgi:ABC-type uncharacterized transport system involved in gliding motility auxiliary subunit